MPSRFTAIIIETFLSPGLTFRVCLALPWMFNRINYIACNVFFTQILETGLVFRCLKEYPMFVCLWPLFIALKVEFIVWLNCAIVSSLFNLLVYVATFCVREICGITYETNIGEKFCVVCTQGCLMFFSPKMWCASLKFLCGKMLSVWRSRDLGFLPLVFQVIFCFLQWETLKPIGNGIDGTVV